MKKCILTIYTARGKISKPVRKTQRDEAGGSADRLFAVAVQDRAG